MNKYFWLIALLGLLCFLSSGCKENKFPLAEKELSDLKPKDVTNFQVILRPPSKEMTITDEKDISELIGILNKVTIYEKDDSYTEYVGQWVEFKLKMADDSSKTIVAFNPFIIIDGIGYKTEYEPCEELNAFGNSIIK